MWADGYSQESSAISFDLHWVWCDGSDMVVPGPRFGGSQDGTPLHAVMTSLEGMDGLSIRAPGL